MLIACALAEALHHFSGTKPSTCDTMVVEGAKNDALRGQNTVTRARERGPRGEPWPTGQTRPLSGMRPAPVQEEGIQRHTGIGYELVLDPVVPQMVVQLVEVVGPVPAVFQASSPAVEYFAPAPAVFQTSSPVVEFFAPAPAVTNVCGGVYCTGASLVRNPGARCGAHLTRTSGFISCSNGGEYCTRAVCVSLASASGGALLTCASCVLSSS